MYVCFKCEKHIKELDESFVRCPHCGCRTLFKERPNVTKELKAE
ncbi:DNA-directed RNA polymerase subunit P [Candidatus Micrarchaeota archaeon]|nr:DNA-directed RNA polymerase subunit P [Candidatus Micrarchaeota archaeon]